MKQLAIFGVPRSGTSWLGQIFNSSKHVAYRYQPLFSHALKGFLDFSSTSADIEAFHQAILESEDPFLLQEKNISGNQQASFNKQEITHLVWKEVRYLHLIEHLLEYSRMQIIGILRHPCAVMNSWFLADREFQPEWDQQKELLLATSKNQTRPEEFYGLAKWAEAYRAFQLCQSKWPQQFTLVHYKDLLDHTEAEVNRLFGFFSLPLEQQTLGFINESTSYDDKDPYGVHRHRSSDDFWRQTLDTEIQEMIASELSKLDIHYD